MAKINIVTLALALVFFVWPVQGARLFNKRGDLDNITPVSESGYTVPLQGGWTCVNQTNCRDSLPAPATDKTLKVLAIARGLMIYDCTHVNESDAPTYESQSTTLYDAGPLIPFLTNEEALHKLVAQFYDFDYSELVNSTLMCIGSIYTEGRMTIINLDRIETFPVHLQSAIEPPDDAAFNALWAHSVDVDGLWEVYRVETAGGAVPADCSGHNSSFDVGYAAEYWFYVREG